MLYRIQVEPNEQSTPDHLNNSINFFWSFKLLTRWMYLIGIPPPAVTESVSCQLNRYFRIVIFFLVLLLHSCILMDGAFNTKSITQSYVSGISTTALFWNLIIDGLNLGMYVVGGHSVLLLLTRPQTWRDLTSSFQLLDEDLPTIGIYLQSRRLTIYAIVYIPFSVFFTKIKLLA